MDTTPIVFSSPLQRRSRSGRLGLLALLEGTGLHAGCASTSPLPLVAAVTPFDLQRYQGRWYELARLDHAFERAKTDVSPWARWPTCLHGCMGSGPLPGWPRTRKPARQWRQLRARAGRGPLEPPAAHCLAGMAHHGTRVYDHQAAWEHDPPNLFVRR
ncbi:lipocalin family protein [Cupriavidus sp. amp6]|uniref:lipocalin family protein n=1 Tax=Cupriavidus sp. amp6 TaxID=388051 RepID=UPI000404C771|nr:lipocalin family protein [Cupriavidus sp. amp6]